MTTLTGTEYFQDVLLATGVTYEIVSNIPKVSETPPLLYMQVVVYIQVVLYVQIVLYI